jgi:biotin transport system substrate-specific component
MMTALAPAAPRRLVLADRVFPRNVAISAIEIVAGAGLTALLAQLVIPLWPVPITGQTFAVLFVGATLGSIRGALSMGLYLVVGVLGAPIFAAGGSGSLIGSTSGGFVVGFVVAAFVTGFLAERQWDRKVLRTFVAFAAGTIVMYAFGLPWLFAVLSTFDAATMTQYFGTTDVFAATIQGGLVPFLVGDTIKAILAAVLLPVTWKLLSRRDSKPVAE